jgi:transcriptional regulator with XRE-family HTH domain
LSLEIGVSQRHISFVEKGRARPSRELLITWLHALDAPLTVRNAALLQAGFAPHYPDTPIDAAALGAAQRAISQLLEAHDPMPALVLDAHWNLVRTNRGGRWLADALMPGVVEQLERGAPLNMLDVLMRADGPCSRMLNLREVAPELIAHLRREAAALPALQPKVLAVIDSLRSRLGSEVGRAPTAPAPVLTTRYRTAVGDLAFFSMYTTFGTPYDITLESLRLEHLFPADEQTRAVLTSQLA